MRVIKFLIVAFAVFLLIKAINTLARKKPPAPPPPAAPPEDVVLLREIRDLLAKRAGLTAARSINGVPIALITKFGATLRPCARYAFPPRRTCATEPHRSVKTSCSRCGARRAKRPNRASSRCSTTAAAGTA